MLQGCLPYAAAPTLAGTPSSKLLERCSHNMDPGAAPHSRGKAILGSGPNDHDPESATQGAVLIVGCCPKMHCLLLVDSYLAAKRASGSHHNSHNHAFVLLIHLGKTDTSKDTKKHLGKEKLSGRNFMNVIPAAPLIIFQNSSNFYLDISQLSFYNDAMDHPR